MMCNKLVIIVNIITMSISCSSIQSCIIGVSLFPKLCNSRNGYNFSKEFSDYGITKVSLYSTLVHSTIRFCLRVETDPYI